MSFRLSVLDQSPIIGDATPSRAIQSTVALAKLADELGYHRFWLAEHHGLEGLADASPEILLARLGADTSRIRLGTGGVLLPYHTPFKLVEQFSMLSALYPGRIDLGIGRAPGGDGRVANAVSDGNFDHGEHHLRKLSEISGLLRDAIPEGHPLHSVRANPSGVIPPELWMLGSSEGGVSIACHMGLRFAFAHFINPAGAVPVSRLYKQHFRAGHEEAPYLAVAVLAACTETDEEARAVERAVMLRWARTGQGINQPIPTVDEAAAHEFSPLEKRIADRDRPRAIIGTTADVADRIRALQAETDADEIILLSLIPSYDLREATLRRLAKAFEIGV
jgi:luciferase family oxidoreductase group 1